MEESHFYATKILSQKAELVLNYGFSCLFIGTVKGFTVVFHTSIDEIWFEVSKKDNVLLVFLLLAEILLFKSEIEKYQFFLRKDSWKKLRKLVLILSKLKWKKLTKITSTVLMRKTVLIWHKPLFRTIQLASRAWGGLQILPTVSLSVYSKGAFVMCWSV